MERGRPGSRAHVTMRDGTRALGTDHVAGESPPCIDTRTDPRTRHRAPFPAPACELGPKRRAARGRHRDRLPSVGDARFVSVRHGRRRTRAGLEARDRVPLGRGRLARAVRAHGVGIMVRRESIHLDRERQVLLHGRWDGLAVSGLERVSADHLGLRARGVPCPAPEREAERDGESSGDVPNEDGRNRGGLGRWSAGEERAAAAGAGWPCIAVRGMPPHIGRARAVGRIGGPAAPHPGARDRAPKPDIPLAARPEPDGGSARGVGGDDG